MFASYWSGWLILSRFVFWGYGLQIYIAVFFCTLSQCFNQILSYCIHESIFYQVRYITRFSLHNYLQKTWMFYLYPKI